MTARLRSDLVVALMRAAAEEYARSIDNGSVTDLFAYAESQGFLAVASDEVTRLAAEADPLAGDIASRIAAALSATGAAFGEIGAGAPAAGDPAILFSAAAAAELASYRLR